MRATSFCSDYCCVSPSINKVDCSIIIITHMKKLLDSDWLRAVQFK